MKSVVTDPQAYDWEGDAAPEAALVAHHHLRDACARVYRASQLRVCRNRNAAHTPDWSRRSRTFSNSASPRSNCFPSFSSILRMRRAGRTNYWGYSPVSFFAPHQAYSSRQEPLGAVDEFRDMVKALHRAGIEVILDVVFNHTAEDGHDGPTQCFRGLDNPTYYVLCEDRSRYANFTGTGNTLNANHPVVRRMIVDSLRYWVTGDARGWLPVRSRIHPCARFVRRRHAESSGALGHRVRPGAGGHQDDCGGMGRGGTLPGRQLRGRQLEGVERPVSRRHPRLLPGCERFGWARSRSSAWQSRASMARRSAKLEESINFVACHDGFTLNDLVSYNHKHNEANGEDNRDGHDDNRSWNCGFEGPTDDPEIETLRNRQVKNFFAAPDVVRSVCRCL